MDEGRLQFALRGSNIGIWQMQLTDGTLQNSRLDFSNICEHLGWELPKQPADFATAMALIHPADEQRFTESLQAFWKPRSPSWRLNIESYITTGTTAGC